MILGLIGVVLAIGFGVYVAVRDHKVGHQPRRSKGGWIYFAAADEGPVRIGSHEKEPTKQRCRELSDSPVKLRIFFKFETPNVFIDERKIKYVLRDDHDHGDWYERDATLAYISHLRGEH